MLISGDFLLSAIGEEEEEEALMVKFPFWVLKLAKWVTEKREEKGGLIEFDCIGKVEPFFLLRRDIGVNR